MELPIIPDENVQRERIRRRLSLNNRPSLSVDSDRLKALSLSLSSSSEERVRFVSNPTTYLNEHDIRVTDAMLIENSQPTSETAAAAVVGVLWFATVAVTVVAVGYHFGAVANVAMVLTVFAAVGTSVHVGCDGSSSLDAVRDPLGQFGSTVV